jgi:opacity protein-like surface antigen
MNKSLLFGVAILALSTSVALAATHHRHAMKPKAPAVATNQTGAGSGGWLGGGVSNSDRQAYAKNQRDSGLGTKK